MLLFRLVPLAALLQLCSAQIVAKPYHQNRFEVLFDRGTMTWMNKSMVTVAELYTFKYNRTMKVCNLTLDFVYDVREIKAKVALYRFTAANRYAKTAIQFTMDICAAIKLDVFGFGMAKTRGTFTDCPMKKGYYYAANIHITDEKLPPSVPEGKYRYENLVYLNGIHSYDFELYLEIRYLVHRNKIG